MWSATSGASGRVRSILPAGGAADEHPESAASSLVGGSGCVTFERALELILGNLGTLILLLIILIGGFRGWWVYGRFYDAQSDRIERLERRLDRAVGAAET